MLYASTGLRNLALHTLSIRDVFNRGCAVLKLFGGTEPADADAAQTGTLLCTITNDGATVKVKKKIRITPTPGTSNAGVWAVKLNETLVSFTDDGTPTATEICTGLFNAWRVASGLIAATTPPHTANNPDVFQKFAFTDNLGTLDIESATAGVAFDYSVSATGAGIGTGTIATSVLVADAYGLRFEAVGDIVSGIIEKLEAQTWRGTNIASGTATHYRFVLDGDTGIFSTVASRIQGQIATANSDMNIRIIQFETGEMQYITGKNFSLEFPASRI